MSIGMLPWICIIMRNFKIPVWNYNSDTMQQNSVPLYIRV